VRVLYSAIDVGIPAFHGGASHVQESVSALEKLGHEVFLVSQGGWGKPLAEKKRNVSIYRVPVFFEHGFLRVLNLWLFSIPLFIYLLSFKVVDFVYERNRVFGNCAVVLGKILGKKCVIEMNEPLVQAAEQEFGHSPKFYFVKWWFYFTARFADVVTVTHKCMAFGLPKEKILKIHYGANPEKFYPARRNPAIVKRFSLKTGKTVFYSGSFREWHALRETIEAAAIAVKRDRSLKFLFAGRGEKFQEAKKLAEEKGLRRNVVFLGRVPFSRMNSYINSSDTCLALFSCYYPLFRKCSYFYSALKVHEYKACGKPVIATKMGNLRKMVKHGKNGLLVSNSPKEIAAAVLKLSRSSALRKRMGKRNRTEVLEKYNWIAVTEKVLRAVKARE